MKALVALLCALLVACSPPPVTPPVQTATQAPAIAQAAVAAPAPLPVAVEEVAPAVQEPVVAAVEALEAVLPAPPVDTAPVDEMAACRHAAADLIARWEITGRSYYTARLQRPVWPKGGSGVTWAVGYDGGTQSRRTILGDWVDHQAVERLATTAGITGKPAGAILPRYRDIIVPYDHAFRVFETRSLREYENITARVYRVDLAALPPTVCAALVSVTYNRGGAMSGDNNREKRAIRDDCLHPVDRACIAGNIRSMKRLWINTVNERGLSARRESEALLAES